MSIRSLTALAVARDTAAPADPVKGGKGAAAVGPPSATAATQTFVDVLISAIPTEPLAAYTALVGIAAGVADAAHPRTYLAYRWWCYAAFLTVTALAVLVSYLRAANGSNGSPEGTRRRAPWAEEGAALIAAGAWGLAMPGSPLDVQLSGATRTLVVASVTVGAAVVLLVLFGPQLKTGTNKTPTQPTGAPTSSGPAQPASNGSSAPLPVPDPVSA